MRDVPSQFPEITSLIDGIDRAQPQVEIEARIVQTNKTYARALGVQWGFGGRVDPSLGNTTNLAFPNNGSLTGRTGASQGPATGSTTGQPTAVNLGVARRDAARSAWRWVRSTARSTSTSRCSALESSGNGRLLSTPRVTTQNNVAAEMTQGVQIPIQTVVEQHRHGQLQGCGADPEGHAADHRRPTPSSCRSRSRTRRRTSAVRSTTFPPINTQRANTQVLVSDGQTTVIGGIYVSNSTLSSDKTPGLGNVPLLKWLFKRDRVDESNTELLIFITPRIIKS